MGASLKNHGGGEQCIGRVLAIRVIQAGLTGGAALLHWHGFSRQAGLVTHTAACSPTLAVCSISYSHTALPVKGTIPVPAHSMPLLTGALFRSCSQSALGVCSSFKPLLTTRPCCLGLGVRPILFMSQASHSHVLTSRLLLHFVE